MKKYVCKIHGETACYEHTAFKKDRGKFSVIRNCKICNDLSSKRSTAKNPGRFKEWISKNREHYLETKRTYREANKDKTKAKVAEWKQNNPDLVRFYNSKRRAIKRNSEVNDLTLAEWLSILEAYEYKCAYCGRDDLKLTQDHDIPLSRGGNHTKNNIVPACTSCNCKKHTRTKEEYEQSV